MKKEELSNAFEYIDDSVIDEVNKARNSKPKPKHRKLIRYIAFAACFCLIFTSLFFTVPLFNVAHAQDLMEGITPNYVEPIDLDAYNERVTDFAIRLFKASQTDGKSSLVSPLSVMCALSMALNGADGETRAQMESVLGMTAEELNNYLYSYINSLPIKNKYKLKVANSIWYRDSEFFVPNRDFLQTNADYYGAQLYQSDFDSSTLNEINEWVERETDGMIPRILDHLDDDSLMVLVNTLAFQADWKEIYETDEIFENVFTLEDGTEKNVKFMYGDQRKYFESDNCIGFIKNYVGDKYAFAAILPDEGISMSDFLDTLTGEKVSYMLANEKNGQVSTRIPKFKTEYNVHMKDALTKMGMPDAFSPECADFGLMGSFNGNVYIDNVIHKTFIEVNERGTRAGAATAIPTLGITGNGSVSIYLDRPFVYMLIDLDTKTPFFIGTMMDPAI